MKTFQCSQKLISEILFKAQILTKYKVYSIVLFIVFSIPGSSSTPQAAKKPKPSQSTTPSEDIEIEPHLEDVDIKSIKAEPEPSGSGSGGPGGSHAAMVEADLGDESYGASGADGDDNGDFGAEGEFEGFDQYGEENEFDDSMSAASGSDAAVDGKDNLDFVTNEKGHPELVDSSTRQIFQKSYKKNNNKTFWKCLHYKKLRCPAKVTTEECNVVTYFSEHNHE